MSPDCEEGIKRKLSLVSPDCEASDPGIKKAFDPGIKRKLSLVSPACEASDPGIKRKLLLVSPDCETLIQE